jgi:hypothetical protein
MAQRDNRTKRAKGDTIPADALEKRVLAFAEQLGQMAGTIAAKAEGWMDRKTLHKQIASVRDSAAHLVEQLAGGVTKTPKTTPVAAATRSRNTGRSGGAVDAPGKKHRRPAPPDPGANVADSQAAKVRTAKMMQKTNRHRGRG